MAERFSAFISYSHADEPVARWLHRAIESYRFPTSVVGTSSPFGSVPRRLPPVFRDRDELAASGDLGAELRAALAQSRFQIVICSPRAARSHWVNEEILLFKRQHGEHRTVALIAGGEPYGGVEDECFPAALRFRLGENGTLSTTPAEPIAADIRPGKDGRRLALLKLLAGISGVRLDALVRRDAARRQRRLAAIATVSSVVALVTVGLAIYAESQRRVAVAQRDLAEKSLAFLVGTFEIANPATENPRTITALTVLERASTRAGGEFRRQPAVAARLLRTTGEIYTNLGLPREAERDLRQALAMGPRTGAPRALTLLKLASLARASGDVDRHGALVNEAERTYPADNMNRPEIAALIAEHRAHGAFLRADYRRAAALYAAARASYAALPGDYRQEVANNLMNVACALVQAGDYAQADPLYAQAVQLFTAQYGLRDVRTASALHNQALAALSAGQPDRAAARMAEAMGIYRRVLDPAHPKLAAAQLLQGRIALAQGDAEPALRSLDAARALYARLYGPSNPAVGDAGFFAAEAHAAAGRTAEALRLTQEVGRIYTAAYGPDDPDQAELLLLRARILERGGDARSAQNQCRRALALQQRIGTDAPVLRQTSSYCGKLAA